MHFIIYPLQPGTWNIKWEKGFNTASQALILEVLLHVHGYYKKIKIKLEQVQRKANTMGWGMDKLS